MNFRIFETEQFTGDLEEKLAGPKEKIILKLRNTVYPQLRNQPFFGKNIKKLRNYKPPTWRYRIGDFRFFYTIDDKEKIVFMLTVDHRSKAY